MDKSTPKFQEGQTVYLSDTTHSHKPCLSTTQITKVGRKWVECGMHGRFDRQTLVRDGGEYSSPGRAYLSADDWHAEQELEEAWSTFRQAIGRDHRVPKDLTIEKLKEAAAALNIPLNLDPDGSV